MTYTCPHTLKPYTAEIIEQYDVGGVITVVVYCYWCDGAGKFRWEKGFNPGNPQPHYYDLPKEKER